MTQVSEVEAALHEFALRVPELPELRMQFISIAEARDRKGIRRQRWSWNAGVYLFFREGELCYIGRALASTGLCQRVLSQVTSIGDPPWDAVLEHPSTTIGLVALEPENSIWAASLELYLIERFSAGTVNKRRC